MNDKLLFYVNPFMPIPAEYANALSYEEVQRLIIAKINQIVDTLVSGEGNIFVNIVQKDCTIAYNSTEKFMLDLPVLEGYKFVGVYAHSFSTSDYTEIEDYTVDNITNTITVNLKNNSETKDVSGNLTLVLNYKKEFN